MNAAPVPFAAILSLTSLLGAPGFTAPESGEQEHKWVATWTTPISGALTKTDVAEWGLSKKAIAILQQRPESAQADFDALPDGQASDQSFRMIVKPDLWGDTVRVRLSNVFGSHEISLTAVAIGLRESGGNLVRGTSVRFTFGGKPGVLIPQGREVLSDPLHLSFVTNVSKPWLAGRELAVSFTISGKSGLLSSHAAPVTSYIARPNSGDHTGDEDDSAFPYVTKSFFLVKEVDVLADPDTAVVCALGDSITAGGMTVNGYDGWSDDLSIRAHRFYGDKVSIVNMGIRGNTVVTVLNEPGATDPVVKRLDRDVLSIAGLTSVVLLAGINDLGAGQSRPEPITEGYRQVVTRLHARGITVVGATVTSSLRPEPYDDSIPAVARTEMDKYGNARTNSYRQQVDEFIRTSGLFDSVADMEKATEDPATGALYKQFQEGDYLHPNRAGHQAMAAVVDLQALAPRGTRRTAN
jgi:lysophospholipase L1-like esterase